MGPKLTQKQIKRKLKQDQIQAALNEKVTAIEKSNAERRIKDEKFQQQLKDMRQCLLPEPLPEPLSEPLPEVTNTEEPAMEIILPAGESILSSVQSLEDVSAPTSTSTAVPTSTSTAVPIQRPGKKRRPLRKKPYKITPISPSILSTTPRPVGPFSTQLGSMTLRGQTLQLPSPQEIPLATTSTNYTLPPQHPIEMVQLRGMPYPIAALAGNHFRQLPFPTSAYPARSYTLVPFPVALMGWVPYTGLPTSYAPQLGTPLTATPYQTVPQREVPFGRIQYTEQQFSTTTHQVSQYPPTQFQATTHSVPQQPLVKFSVEPLKKVTQPVSSIAHESYEPSPLVDQRLQVPEFSVAPSRQLSYSEIQKQPIQFDVNSQPPSPLETTPQGMQQFSDFVSIGEQESLNVRSNVNLETKCTRRPHSLIPQEIFEKWNLPTTHRHAKHSEFKKSITPPISNYFQSLDKKPRIANDENQSNDNDMVEAALGYDSSQCNNANFPPTPLTDKQKWQLNMMEAAYNDYTKYYGDM